MHLIVFGLNGFAAIQKTAMDMSFYFGFNRVIALALWGIIAFKTCYVTIMPEFFGIIHAYAFN